MPEVPTLYVPHDVSKIELVASVFAGTKILPEICDVEPFPPVVVVPSTIDPKFANPATTPFTPGTPCIPCGPAAP